MKRVNCYMCKDCGFVYEETIDDGFVRATMKECPICGGFHIRPCKPNKKPQGKKKRT